MSDDILKNDNETEVETENGGADVEAGVQQSAPEDISSEDSSQSTAALDNSAAENERTAKDWTVPAIEKIDAPVSAKKSKGTTVAAAVLAVIIVGVIAALAIRIISKQNGGEAEPETTPTVNAGTVIGGDTREYTIDDYSITDGEGAIVPASQSNASGVPGQSEDEQTHVAVANGTIVVSSVREIAGSDQTTIVYNTVPVPGEPTGVNKISDDASNKYIQIVSNEYSVDAALLVAIYPENFDGNESDDNFVLQFDGTKDASGNVVRSPETLEIVYKVDSQKNVIVNKKVGIAGQLVFSMVTDLIMPQHPDFFTGVD